MGKKKDDRRQKVSSEKQPRPQHTKGSAYRLPLRLDMMSEQAVAWGDRMSITPGDDVPPDMWSTLPAWDINDSPPTTNAIGQRSRGQAATSVAVSASLDLRAYEDNNTPDGSSAISTPHASEVRGRRGDISGSNPDVHSTLPTSAYNDSRLLPPVPLPTLHPHSPHAAPDVSDPSRFHPYRPQRPRHNSRQTTQLEEHHVSMSDGAIVSDSSYAPQGVITDPQVSSTAAYLPQMSFHADTGALYWPGTMDPAALGGMVVQEGALGLDIAAPPAHLSYQYPQAPPFGYPTVSPQATSFSGQNGAIGPLFQPLDSDYLATDHQHLYHTGNAHPQRGIVQGWSSTDQPNQPSEHEDLAQLCDLDMPLAPFGIAGLDDWLAYPQDGGPPPPPSYQWPQ